MLHTKKTRALALLSTLAAILPAQQAPDGVARVAALLLKKGRTTRIDPFVDEDSDFTISPVPAYPAPPAPSSGNDAPRPPRQAWGGDESGAAAGATGGSLLPARAVRKIGADVAAVRVEVPLETAEQFWRRAEAAVASCVIAPPVFEREEDFVQKRFASNRSPEEVVDSQRRKLQHYLEKGQELLEQWEAEAYRTGGSMWRKMNHRRTSKKATSTAKKIVRKAMGLLEKRMATLPDVAPRSRAANVRLTEA